jgi:3-oxoacyl-ACP reductase-like protein
LTEEAAGGVVAEVARRLELAELARCRIWLGRMNSSSVAAAMRASPMPAGTLIAGAGERVVADAASPGLV